MKFSIRQILASTAGAVAAALIASIFGVKGTIVGVAIGSAAATMATAFVAQSIDRGHEAVKQVAIRAPESSALLRRLGGTGASGDSASSVDASSAPTEVVGQSAPQGRGDADTVEMTSTAAASDAAETERVSPVAADAPATQRLQAAPAPTPRAARRSVATGFSWRAIAAAAGIVFVLALLLITAIELISGKPLSTIFGGADTGTSLNNLVNPKPAPAPTPTPTTSTTSTVSTTTTTTTAGSTSTTTSTTAPTGSATTTTTTPAPSSTTTTTGPALSGRRQRRRRREPWGP